MTEVFLRPLAIGEVLDGAFTLYRRHFAVLLTTTLILCLPMGLLNSQLWLLEGTADQTTTGAAAGGMVLLVILASLIGLPITWGALTRQVTQGYTGGPVTIRDGLTSGFRAFLPLLGSVTLAYLGTVAIFVVPGIVAAIVVPSLAARGGGVTMALFGIVTLIGVLLAMPAIAASFFALVPAIIVERLGPWAALRRSWQLARGGRLRIIGVFVICWLITMLPMMAVMTITGIGAAVLNPEMVGQSTTGLAYLQNIIMTLMGSLTVPYMVGCMVLLYYDRRIRLEGYDLEAAAEALVAVG
jgi:hypothetical protein